MGTPSPKPITQTNKVELGPEQQQVLSSAMPGIQRFSQSTPQIFPGSGIAGFDPSELAAQMSYLNLAAPQAQNLAGQASTTQHQLLDPNFMLNPNQYTDAAANAVTNRAEHSLMDTILPGIRSGATVSGGQYSGGATRQGTAEGVAIGRNQDAVSNSLADMFLRNYQTGLGGLRSAVDANPGVITQQLMPADIMGAVGADRRAMEQAKLDEQARNFYATQDIDLNRSRELLGLVNAIPGASGVSTVTGSQPTTNPLMQALGVGLAGTAMLSGMPGAAAGIGSLGLMPKTGMGPTGK